MKKAQIFAELKAKGYRAVQINEFGHIWAEERNGSTFVRWIVEYGKLLPCDIKVFRVDRVADFKSEASIESGIIPRAAFGFFFPKMSLN